MEPVDFSCTSTTSTMRSGAEPSSSRKSIFSKIVERGQPAAGALDDDAVEGVALVQQQLAADDLVFRAGVADDVDALDVDARTFDDVVGDVERARRLVALDVRIDAREDEALAGGLEREVLDRLVDAGGVVIVADAGPDLGDQIVRIELGIADVHGDIGHLVALAFLDRVGDGEAGAVGVQHRIGRDHAHVGEAVAAGNSGAAVPCRIRGGRDRNCRCG